MKPLTQSGAAHFVGQFGADASVAGYSVEDFLATLSASSHTFTEGTPRFDQLKDCLLRESERSLLMSSS
jgi:hypothetical protein